MPWLEKYVGIIQEMKHISIHLNSNESPQLPQRVDNGALYDTRYELGTSYHVKQSDSLNYLFGDYDFKEDDPNHSDIQEIKDLEITIYTNDSSDNLPFNFCLVDANDNIVDIQNVRINIYRGELDKTLANVNIIDACGIFVSSYAEHTDVKYCSLRVGDISWIPVEYGRGCGGIMGSHAGYGGRYKNGASSIENTYVTCGKLGTGVSGMMGSGSGLMDGTASIVNSCVVCSEISEGASGMMGEYPGQQGIATIETSYVICDNIVKGGYKILGLLAGTSTATIDGIDYTAEVQLIQQRTMDETRGLSEQLVAANTARDRLTEDVQSLTTDRISLETHLDTALSKLDDVETERGQLTEEVQSLESDRTALETNLQTLNYNASIGGWQIYVSNQDMAQHSFNLMNINGNCTYEKATRTTDDTMYRVYIGKNIDKK